GKVQLAETSEERGRRQPALVCLETIGADAQHIALALLELANAAAHRRQFRRTDQREITGIKQQDQPAIEKIVLRTLPAAARRAARTSQREGWRSHPNLGKLFFHYGLASARG